MEFDSIPIEAIRTKANRSRYYVHHGDYGKVYRLWVELTRTASTLYYVGHSVTPIERVHNHLEGYSNIDFLDTMNITGVEAAYPCDISGKYQCEAQAANDRTLIDSDTACVSLDDVTSFAYWA
ncbi:hypothetical protein ACFR99_05975 [Haloarchaeobius amylolyticus]|uniref:GIY-YIG domain-containing protein n=1 Tax=Haloarchaeobius amylolyticus TaxID=1198296 RepID=A0ABD6BE76_9EURY